MIKTTDLRIRCVHCGNEFCPTMPILSTHIYASFYFCVKCENKLIIQPERSKREDSHSSECIPVILHDCCRTDCIKDGKCSVEKKREMRCSEHCGNTVREAQ